MMRAYIRTYQFSAVRFTRSEINEPSALPESQRAHQVAQTARVQVQALNLHHTADNPDTLAAVSVAAAGVVVGTVHSVVVAAVAAGTEPAAAGNVVADSRLAVAAAAVAEAGVAGSRILPAAVAAHNR